ncbi:MAG: putative peptidoglycan glycosyltransferase FtsW [Verrucomicrobiota bacterium]|nr:putative peptidoglycan glycosyltransferase FtsW [Verrucomicrobiota bacterium]MEC7857202.1 putative peptidoglycan glycosyltransferase FtsW [Verrucomicrobiota bacterium]MEC8657848.1 putative peptidoglycan glycosyltransferase FtsW [Verrucomicrobiota bacterium]MEC8691424.1 putative peptidoglycan glycosyltransferase FtsW [Verrucomicrobiota bacterium]
MGERSLIIFSLSIISLLVLGIVMLLSTSVYISERSDIYHDVSRQFIWMVMGFVLCAFTACIDYHFWYKTRWLWFVLSIIALILCFVPPIAQPANGSSRWIGLEAFGVGFARIQPSELAKISLMFVLAGWCSKYHQKSSEIKIGFIYPILIALIPVSLIAVETDMGTAALLICASLIVMFVSGSNIKMFFMTACSSVGVLALAVWYNPNRLERFIAFLDLEAHKTGFGLQQWRAQLAMGEGGISGLGLGEGREKLMYMPFAHTDFIFPMIGEELGGRVTLSVVLIFVLILVFGVSISNSAPDRFGKLLGFGLITLISLQALLNIGVTTGCLPNKGLPLPFVSYGGSNLLFCLAAVGIVLNIYRQGHEPVPDPDSKLLEGHRTLPRI